MQLVIAEKPSVARDLARVLGVRGTGRHALSDGRRTISWCIGHLVELEEPAAYDPRWKSWRFDTLPMIPAAFKLRPVPGTRDQFRAVLRAAARPPVHRGRQRLRRGTRGRADLSLRLRAGRQPAAGAAAVDLVADGRRHPAGVRGAAARCRIPGAGGRGPLPIGGRLAGGDERDPRGDAGVSRGGRRRRAAAHDRHARRSRRCRPSTPSAGSRRRRWPSSCGASRRSARFNRATTGRCAEPSRRPSTATRRSPRCGRCERSGTSRSRASASAPSPTQIVARARAHAAASDPLGPVVESLDQKRSREPPPLLFDLTSLQRTANRRYGFSATRTLEVAQALYERHKVLTYPRTDSRHLPLDQAGELPKLFRAMAKIPVYAPFAAAARRRATRAGRALAPHLRRRQGARPPRDHSDGQGSR